MVLAVYIYLLIITIIGVIVSALWELIDKKILKRNKKKAATKNRIKEITKSLKEATESIRDFETEIIDRSDLIKKSEKDIETYEKHVKLREQNIELMIQVVRAEISRELRRQISVNFLFFILGVATTIILKFAF